MKILPLAIIPLSLTLAACSSGGSNDNTSGANALLSQAATGTSTVSPSTSTSNTTPSNTTSTANSATSSTTASTAAANTASNTANSAAATDTASNTANSTAATDTTANAANSAATTNTAANTANSAAVTDTASNAANSAAATNTAANTANSATTDTASNAANSATATDTTSNAANSEATTDTASNAANSAATDAASNATDSSATTDTSSSTTDSSATTQSETLTAEQVQQALSQTFASSSETLTGALVSFNKDSVTTSNPTSNEIETLQIDGKTLTLYTEAEKQNTAGSDKLKTVKGDGYTAVFGSYHSDVNGKGNVKVDEKYKNMRYGTYTTNDNVTTLFLQGNIASKLPERSVYTYKGNAIYGKDGNYQQLVSTATANFNVKKIKVELSEAAGGPAKLTFGGDINTETKRISGTDSEGIVMEGAFFGEQGIVPHDVGGIFYQTQGAEAGYNGVFGATGRTQSKDKAVKESTTVATDY